MSQCTVPDEILVDKTHAKTSLTRYSEPLVVHRQRNPIGPRCYSKSGKNMNPCMKCIKRTYDCTLGILNMVLECICGICQGLAYL